MYKYLIRLLILLAVIYFTPLGAFIRPWFTSKAQWFEGIEINAFGTGFYVNDQDVITNNHVIAGCSRIFVGGRDRRVATATLIAADARNDLAALRTPSRVASVLALSDGQEIKAGEEAIYPDYTSGQGEFSLGYLTIKKLDGDYIYAGVGMRFGNSGSPLMDEYGRVIGVVKGGTGEGWLGFLNLTGYSLAANMSRLSGFLHDNHIPYAAYTGKPVYFIHEPDYRGYIAVNIGCFRDGPWFTH